MTIEPGQRYLVGDRRLRCVLAVGNDRVLYTRGGDRHFECRLRTFRRWLRSLPKPSHRRSVASLDLFPTSRSLQDVARREAVGKSLAGDEEGSLDLMAAINAMNT